MKTETFPRPARSFRNGNSIAVRLPKGWVKPGMAFKVSRHGELITLESDTQKPKTLADVLKRMRKYNLADEEFVREHIQFPARDFD